jgi:hypothetical protein
MKINKKVISLLEGGFSMQTLRGMSENNINYLYTKVMKEQTTQTKGSITTKNEPKAIQLAAKGYNVRLEKKEMGEAKKKSQTKNPFAICTAQLKKEFGTSERSEWTKPQIKKYERCVMDVKKGVKEGVNPIDVFIENEMDRMIESYSKPKVTKSALLRHLREQDAPTIKPVVKPAKPTTKPTRRDNPFINPNPKVNPDPKANTETKPVVKPAKPTTKPTRRDNPFINPNPKVNTPPKAISPEKAKNAIIDNIMQLLNFEN